MTTDPAGCRRGCRQAAHHAVLAETRRKSYSAAQPQRRTILAAMIAIVLNPTSGVMRRPHLREQIDELCRAAGIDACIRTVASPHETLATVRAARDSRPAALVAAGGDGTVSAAAAAVCGTSIPLGVLPLGTLNHFAKDAGIPIDLEKAVQTVADGHTRQVDVGRV